MATLVRLLLSENQRRLAATAIFGLTFLVLIGLGAVLGTHQVGTLLRAEAEANLASFEALDDRVAKAFTALRDEVSAKPCTAEFQAELRKIAFRPDGLNEFLYTPEGVVLCSTNTLRFATPVSLGQPDIVPAQSGNAGLWIDRGLGFIQLGGLVGTIVREGSFAIIVPPHKERADIPDWLRLQTLMFDSTGRWWHRNGEAGLHERQLIAAGPRGPGFDTSFRMRLCSERGLYCVVGEADLVDVLVRYKIEVSVAILLSALAASWVAARGRAIIANYGSFEVRFRRHLNAASIVCAYQPIMDLKSGAIVGCEVLARWRDVDGSIVPPDRFIPLVEKLALTEEFTRMVVERAFTELTGALSDGPRLRVTFNVFPRDLMRGCLMRIFEPWRAAPNRFDLVVEIVESDAIEIARAQREIEVLRQSGIATYIDDFGTGYSNIQNLAALSIDAVKLDRAFAMAPDDSLMARMLGYAVELIQASGRPVIVEGVETAERLALLRRIVPAVDYAQGYLISRPLDIRRFAEFLTRQALPLPLSRAA